MKLRPATEADVARLYRIHREALGPYVRATWGWDEEFQSSHFREHFDPAKREVIECEGELVGSIDVEELPDRLVLGTIEIEPRHQRQGIGTRLITQLFDRALSLGLPVHLRVLKCNPARQLYERLGFAVTGEAGAHVLMRTTRVG